MALECRVSPGVYIAAIGYPFDSAPHLVAQLVHKYVPALQIAGI